MQLQDAVFHALIRSGIYFITYSLRDQIPINETKMNV